MDIDEQFLRRAARRAEMEGVHVSCVHGDFVESIDGIGEKFDVIVFQAAFHHCLEFKELLKAIRTKLMAPGGVLLLISEPIAKDYPLPWGLRFDGESIWAIMTKKWLELGFDEAFFFHLLLREGYFSSVIPPIPTLLGDGWSARDAAEGIDFARWRLTSQYDATFHGASPGEPGRFCRSASSLPGLHGGVYDTYQFRFRNFSNRALKCHIECGVKSVSCEVQAGGTATVEAKALCDVVRILSETFVPAQQNEGSTDTRMLGLWVEHVAITQS